MQLFAYDTVKKQLSPKPGEQPKIPVPASLVAGAVAGVSSTLFTYPLELVKTRITIQVCTHRDMLILLSFLLSVIQVYVITFIVERGVSEPTRCTCENYSRGRACRTV